MPMSQILLRQHVMRVTGEKKSFNTTLALGPAVNPVLPLSEEGVYTMALRINHRGGAWRIYTRT